MCTGAVNGMDKLLSEAPPCAVEVGTIETGDNGSDMARETGEDTLENGAATFKGALFTTMGGISPVSYEYKSFQYCISL